MMIPIIAWDRELKRYVPVPSMPWVIRDGKAWVPWSKLVELPWEQSRIIMMFIRRHPEAFEYDRRLDAHVLVPKRARLIRQAAMMLAKAFRY